MKLNQQYEFYLYDDSIQDYNQKFQKLFEFDTTEQFIQNYQYLTPINKLSSGFGYAITLKSRFPQYEDQQNMYGRLKLKNNQESQYFFNKTLQCILNNTISKTIFALTYITKKHDNEALTAIWIDNPEEEFYSFIKKQFDLEKKEIQDKVVPVIQTDESQHLTSNK